MSTTRNTAGRTGRKTRFGYAGPDQRQPLPSPVDAAGLDVTVKGIGHGADRVDTERAQQHDGENRDTEKQNAQFPAILGKTPCLFQMN